jgi:mannose-6-phosphate isomerase-like protein (cupin superfamily)
MKIVPKIINKTWGYEYIFYNNEYCSKTLTIYPNQKTSYHYHPIKHEVITVVSGVANIVISGNNYILNQNQSVLIQPNTPHSISNLSLEENLLIAEASTKDNQSDSIRINSCLNQKI